MDNKESPKLPKSSLKRRPRPENPVRLDAPEEELDLEMNHPKESIFPYQEDYDQFVMWDESTQKQLYYVKLKKECGCSKRCKIHPATPQPISVEDYKFSRLGQSELQKKMCDF